MGCRNSNLEDPVEGGLVRYLEIEIWGCLSLGKEMIPFQDAKRPRCLSKRGRDEGKLLGCGAG